MRNKENNKIENRTFVFFFRFFVSSRLVSFRFYLFCSFIVVVACFFIYFFFFLVFFHSIFHRSSDSFGPRSIFNIESVLRFTRRKICVSWRYWTLSWLLAAASADRRCQASYCRLSIFGNATALKCPVHRLMDMHNTRSTYESCTWSDFVIC